MTIAAHLLRLLLCLCLAMGGTAGAHGTSELAAAAAPILRTAATATHGGCHDTPAVAVVQHVGSDAAAGAGHDERFDDCCGTDMCGCSGTAPASVPTVARPPAALLLRGAAAMGDGLVPHRPPRLQHLIRPPIG